MPTEVPATFAFVSQYAHPFYINFLINTITCFMALLFTLIRYCEILLFDIKHIIRYSSWSIWKFEVALGLENTNLFFHKEFGHYS